MNLEITALQCFLSIAESKSFSQTAEKLCRTQSAISQQLTKLEQILGTSLIDRSRKNTLTESGESLLPYARKILKLNQEAIDYFREPELQGEIKFGLPEDFATVFLADILFEFTNSHPRLLVNVECDLTLNLLERFRKNKFDLVLVKTTSLKDIHDGVEIFNEKLVWVKSKNFNPLENDMKFIPLVLSPEPCVYRARALKALEDHHSAWRIVYTSPSFIGATAAVKAGIGITVMPQNMIPEGLVEIHNSDLPDLEDTHISLLIKHQDNKPANSFAKYILNKLHN